MDRKRIISFCEEYLATKDFEDYCHNGLQVEGATNVVKIVSGVSLSVRLIEAAIAEQAQLLIVHHGIFGNHIGTKPQIKGSLRKRLGLLLTHDINLAGFHLPLDAHPEIGNNVSLCRLFGIENLEKFDVGFSGELDKAIPRADFVALVDRTLASTSYVLGSGPDMVKRVAVISGGSSPDYAKAAERACDTFVCGDMRESIVRGAEEIGINVINAGHYNTEKLGIMNLGALLEKEFGIEHMFVDVPCEI
jgi:dinuclear metal center YbgI/SA1388 family protein